MVPRIFEDDDNEDAIDKLLGPTSASLARQFVADIQGKPFNREDWLMKLQDKLGPLFEKAGVPFVPAHVSVGWPSSGGLSLKKRVIGQCWHATSSKDGVPHIFISPWLNSAEQAAETLVHELIHTAYPDAKHRGDFVKGMKALGLTGKPTATVAGQELADELRALIEDIGEYPHAGIDPAQKERKPQKTRMIKFTCDEPECGYQGRSVKKHLEKHGAPECPAHKARGPMTIEWPEGEEPGEGGDDDGE